MASCCGRLYKLVPSHASLEISTMGPISNWKVFKRENFQNFCNTWACKGWWVSLWASHCFLDFHSFLSSFYFSLSLLACLALKSSSNSFVSWTLHSIWISNSLKKSGRTFCNKSGPSPWGVTPWDSRLRWTPHGCQFLSSCNSSWNSSSCGPPISEFPAKGMKLN